MINLHRINELLNGDDPETPEEELFMYSFSAALTGEDLNDVVIALDDQYDLANVSGLEMIIAGYGGGQKQRKIEMGITEEIH